MLKRIKCLAPSLFLPMQHLFYLGKTHIRVLFTETWKMSFFKRGICSFHSFFRMTFNIGSWITNSNFHFHSNIPVKKFDKQAYLRTWIASSTELATSPSITTLFIFSGIGASISSTGTTLVCDPLPLAAASLFSSSAYRKLNAEEYCTLVESTLTADFRYLNL